NPRHHIISSSCPSVALIAAVASAEDAGPRRDAARRAWVAAARPVALAGARAASRLVRPLRAAAAAGLADFPGGWAQQVKACHLASAFGHSAWWVFASRLSARPVAAPYPASHPSACRVAAGRAAAAVAAGSAADVVVDRAVGLAGPAGWR